MYRYLARARRQHWTNENHEINLNVANKVYTEIKMRVNNNTLHSAIYE